MFYTLSIASDIKFSVLDILRGIAIAFVDLIFKTIDVLYDVAHSINSLNFIQMLKNVNNSPFTKIFNAFFIFSFTVLLLFSIWKITFRILDADNNEQPLFELVKEIIKCGFLIFSLYSSLNFCGSNLAVIWVIKLDAKSSSFLVNLASATLSGNITSSSK